MQWAKTTRYQACFQYRGRMYNVLCESDFDGGYAVYINKQFVADVEELPSQKDLLQIIADNIELETSIKSGYAMSGAFE